MLPWFRIRIVLSGNDAKQGCGSSFGLRSLSGSWCWASATWARAMGGGPRTYPGGVTKWQWKRMLVKRREERQQYRLAREKSLHEMRQRAEVIAAHPELKQPWEKLAVFPPPGISAGQQVASLVRRFDRPTQAEDLWSQRDGLQQGRTLSCLDAETLKARPLSGQMQHPSNQPCQDATASNVESLFGKTQHRPWQPYSARWLTMDTTAPKKKKKEVSSIGKSMQDYLDAFDTDPLGVAVEIDTSRSKREVQRDPLGLASEENEAARESPKKQDSSKKKPGKGGRKNRGSRSNMLLNGTR